MAEHCTKVWPKPLHGITSCCKAKEQALQTRKRVADMWWDGTGTNVNDITAALLYHKGI